jgi:hypothetical protein
MQLESFRIYNFRSIKDSGDIETSRITTLLGRNESGKSNLLLGLRTLNPAEGFAELNRTKDFPRYRRLSECTADTPIVSSRWKLTAQEQAGLVKLLPNATNVTHVTVDRPYGNKRSVGFIDLAPIAFDGSAIKGTIADIVQAIKTAAGTLEAAKQDSINAVLVQFEKAATTFDTREKWAASFTAAQGPLNEGLKEAGISMPDASLRNARDLNRLATRLASYQGDEQKARDWIVGQLSCTRFRRHLVRCFMEQEVRHGEKAVYAGVQA